MQSGVGRLSINKTEGAFIWRGLALIHKPLVIWCYKTHMGTGNFKMITN
jgi:hypothetical protein